MVRTPYITRTSEHTAQTRLLVDGKGGVDGKDQGGSGWSGTPSDGQNEGQNQKMGDCLCGRDKTKTMGSGS